MNAQDLFAIVKDVPFFALACSRWELDPGVAQWTIDGMVVDSVGAAMLFEASMLRWLLRNNFHVAMWPNADNDGVWIQIDQSQPTMHTREVEAIASACKSVPQSPDGNSQ